MPDKDPYAATAEKTVDPYAATAEGTPPPVDFSAPRNNKEGLYEMKSKEGASVHVPFSKVEDATGSGYVMNPDVLGRYAKDKKASAPSLNQRYDKATEPFTSVTPHGTASSQTAAEFIQHPTVGGFVKGAAQEAGTALSNIGAGGIGVISHPIDTVGGILRQTPPGELYDTLRGKPTAAEELGQSLREHPLETVEQGVGATAVMDLAGKAPKVAKAVPEAARGFIRETLGAPDATTKAVEQFGDKSASVREGNAAQDEKTLKSRGVVDENNKGIESDNSAAALKHQQDAREAHAKHVAELQKNLHENLETGRTNEAAKAIVDARQGLQDHIEIQSKELARRHEAAKVAAKAENDAAWDSWRKKVGGAEIEPTSVVNAIKETKTLMDPEDVTEFRKVLQETKPGQGEAGETAEVKNQVAIGQGATSYEAASPKLKITIDDIVQRLGLDPDEEASLKSVGADRLHVWKTQLEYAVRKAQRGNVRYGIGKVLDAVRTAESQLSEQAGAGAELNKARALHGPYVETFRNSPNEPATVASKSYQETTPEKARAEAQDERLAMLGNYDPQIPILSQGIKSAHEMLSNLPAESTARGMIKPAAQPPEPPKKTPVSETQKPAQQYGEPHATAPLPDVTHIPEIARTQILKKLQQYKTLSPWEVRILAATPIGALADLLKGDVGKGVARASGLLLAGEIGKQILVRIAEKGSIVDWLAKPGPEVEKALTGLTPRDAARVRTALNDAYKTEIAADPAKAKVKIAPVLNLFLSGGVAAQNQSKSPSEVKKAAQEKQSPPSGGEAKNTSKSPSDVLKMAQELHSGFKNSGMAPV